MEGTVERKDFSPGVNLGNLLTVAPLIDTAANPAPKARVAPHKHID